MSVSAQLKAAGISYLQYLELCSRIVRYSLKEPLRAVAIKRGELGLKSAKWTSGKQGEVKPVKVLESDASAQ